MLEAWCGKTNQHILFVTMFKIKCMHNEKQIYVALPNIKL